MNLFRDIPPRRLGKPTSPFLAAWALFSILQISASADETRFDNIEHLTVDDGLSHNTVWDIHQDRRGFLWFATAGGANRYDGYELKAYYHDPDDPRSISANEVMQIWEDRRGDLWLGTRTGGLNRFDPSTETFERFTHDPLDPDSLPQSRVMEVMESRDGTLWLGTDHGLHSLSPDSLSPDSRKFTHYLHDPADPTSLSSGTVWSLIQDRAGVIWVGTNQGLNQFVPQGGTFLRHEHDPGDPSSLTPGGVNQIFEDRSGRLWVGSDGGLSLLDRETGAVMQFVHDPTNPDTISAAQVMALHEDRSGELWVGTNGTGLSRIVPTGSGRDEMKFVHYRDDGDDPRDLLGDQIFDIHEDDEGILWIATRSGINKYDRRREQFSALRRLPGGSGAEMNQVWSFAEDRAGVIWLGLHGDGVVALDRARGSAVSYRASSGHADGLSRNDVTCVVVGPAGEVWIATAGGGLDRLDPSHRQFTHYRHAPEDPNSLVGNLLRYLFLDNDGYLWIAAYTSGLARLDPEHETFLNFKHDPADPRALSSNNIYSLYEDSSGDLWVGTEAGLDRLDRGSPDAGFTRFSHDPRNPNSLPRNTVTALFEDAAGRFWIGTSGGGLVRMDRTLGKFRTYRQKDGLADDKVVGLVGDEFDALWISTARGLSRFDPATETFHNYDADDGLHGNLFHIGSAFRNSDGEIFFGGDGGLTSFFPHRIKTDSNPPPVVLTDFLLANERVLLRHRDADSPLTRSIGETTELVLDHRHQIVGLEFAALDFAAPRKNRYAYRLEGFDDTWIETDAGKRYAQYTNLDPGRYTFRVKGSNKDGVWNEAGTSVVVRVLPPPWKSWWAYSLYALAFVSAVSVYIRSHRRELQRQCEVAQRERAASRQLREVDQLKDEFLANTSHELRTPLFGIIGLAEAMHEQAAGMPPATLRQQLTTIITSGYRLQRLVGDVLDFSNLKRGQLELISRPLDLRSIIMVTIALLRPLAAGKQLELVNSVPENLSPVLADQNRLEQILLNLLGNAIKFTESGEVKVSARREKETIFISIRDTGIGISPELQEVIFRAFEQGDGSTERMYGGTGLGLAVSRSLVELHGGRLTVSSRPGEGSTFTFSLPVVRQGEPSAAISSNALSSIDQEVSTDKVSAGEVSLDEISAKEIRDPRSKLVSRVAKILVVDDEPINRLVFRRQLEAAGHRVVEAVDGFQALERLEGIDLVLLDVMMPRMSGFEVCEKLRQHYPATELPVIFVTAKNSPESLAAGFAAGGSDYVIKPVTMSELFARIGIHLDLLAGHRHLETLVSELGKRNAQLSQFNNAVSHDLRNPLVTFKNYLDLVEKDARGGDEDNLFRDLDFLRTAAQQMEDRIVALFHYSEINARRPRKVPVEMAPLVHEAVQRITATDRGRGVEVSVNGDIPKVAGDPLLLRELVDELLSNAVKFMGDQESPRIEISAARQGDEVRLSVRDNGLGIEARYHERIFKLFEQLDPASEGCGMGLANAQRRIELIDGSIWVESERPGSTFHCVLQGSL